MGIQDAFSDDEMAHLIFDNSPCGYALHEIVVDEEGQPIDYIFLKVNHAFEEHTGLRASEILGRRVTEVLPGIEKEPFIKIYGLVALTGEPISFEQFSTPLNKYYEIATFSPRKGLFATTFTDITQRIQVSEILREALEKYRLIFDNAKEGISIYEDFSGGSRKLIECNPQYVEMSGYSREELIQISDTRKIQINHNTPQQETKNQEKILSGQPYIGIFSWIRPDGEENYIEYTAAPFNINGKRLTIGIDHNITEQRRLEEQFRQSQKMEAIGMLAGGVAHDFNNLLQVIAAYSEYAIVRLDDKNPVRSYIEEIRKAGEKATILTSQLLAFSHRQILQPQVLSINDLVTNISNMLKCLISEDIEQATILSPGIMPVKVDAGQIEQVIMNIVINARDAMPTGGKLITKTENVIIDSYRSQLIPESRPGSYVCLSISDTGIGMSKEVIQRIFEPFFSTKGLKGTGLGLAVAYGIIRQHEGWINVYSEPRQGSVFRIYLPTVSEKSETEIRGEYLLIGTDGNRERTLLVKDKHQVLEFVT